MHKKIVVPIDGSAASECVLDHVHRIAGKGSEVVLVRVVAKPSYDYLLRTKLAFTIATANVTIAPESHSSGLCRPAGVSVILSVSGTGKGMREETLAHIFEPFCTTKETGKGTGLGLSTVYGIVTQSGSRAAAQSASSEGARSGKPPTGGVELGRRAAELFPGIGVIYVSGYSEDSLCRQGVLEKGTNFLRKPFSASDLLSKIREVRAYYDARADGTVDGTIEEQERKLQQVVGPQGLEPRTNGL